MSESLPVLIPGLPMKEYLDHPGYGSSDLRLYRMGVPAMVPWGRSHRHSTAANTVGSAVACLLMEPETFETRFVVKPEGMEFRSKENKATRDAWLAAGLEIIDYDTMQRVQALVEAFESKGAARDSLHDSCGKEASIFWHCRHSGLVRKARPDWWDEHAVYDLKISRHAATRDKRGLMLAAQQEGWIDQLASNRAGLREVGYPDVKVGRIVVISPTSPHDIRTWLFEVSEEDLDIFELQNESAAKGILGCERADFFPGTPEEWTPLEVLGVINEMSESDAEGAEEADSDNPLI